MENKKQPSQLLIDIITARQDTNGLYIISTHNNDDDSRVVVPLNWYLGIITNCRGTWQPLGMAYNPTPGINCMEIVIYYAVPKNSGFQEQIVELIEMLKKENNNE